MDERIKVLYDISVLSEGFRYQKTRAGTYRVNEELLYALITSQQCEMSYCANNDHLFWYYASEYLRQNPRFKNDEGLAENKWLRSVNRFTGIMAKTNNSGILGFSGSVFNIFEKYLLDPKVLRETAIFHAGFYYPLPSQIKDAGHLRKFLNVYDLIPILHPQLSIPDTTAVLIYNLEVVHKDSFFLCISDCVKNDLCHYLPGLDPDRVFVLPLGVSDAFFPCHDQVKKRDVLQKYGIFDKPYILSVCTLDPRKNLVHLIKCFKDLVRQESLEDLRLVLVGGQGRDYDAIHNELEGGMRDKTIITGYVNDDELSPLYSGALVFVTPSLYEGFSLPTLEAMKCGVPVITSNTSVFPEVVGDAGIMVDPTDKDALCQSILRVYKDGSLRKSMSQKGVERSRLFTWEKSAQVLINAYRTALRK